MSKTLYRTILIDPPWPQHGGGRIKRGADRHYGLLKVRDIVPTILGSNSFTPADDAHLYLRTTNNHMPDAIKVVSDLGFRYVTLLTWAKPGFGIGQYFRGQTEHLIFAVRGDGLGLMRGLTPRRNISTLVSADWSRDGRGRKVHSAKPVEFYGLVETVSPGPRLEMFARSQRPGWDSWGDEVP